MLIAGLRRSLSALSSFFNETATTEIYTLSLHDALPISPRVRPRDAPRQRADLLRAQQRHGRGRHPLRSEEHTSELQSRRDLVCRLLLEKKNSGYSSRFRASASPATASSRSVNSFHCGW